MKEKIKEFFNKLNNSYIIAAICVILIGVILLGAIIGLVARPFSTNTTYSLKVKQMYSSMGDVNCSIKLVLLDDGRYKLTTYDKNTKEVYTEFGDYGYGKVINDENNRRQNVIWLDDIRNAIVIENPFKITVPVSSLLGGKYEFTNVGGIVLLVCYCIVFAICAAIATILIIKRKDGGVVFTNKMRLIKRLKEIEEMIGVKLE
ncbi:MAG: hypothetical protein J1F66_00095 [Clostridiales bacterium]|nr:hypothetical protein [Clostridiales bacterium]